MCIKSDIHNSIKETLPSPDDLGKAMMVDKKLIHEYNKCIHILNLDSQYLNKNKRRRKKDAIRSQFIDTFLSRHLKRVQITKRILNDSILNYFEASKCDYDLIMAELDDLILKPKCDCENVGYGFCFCVNDEGSWVKL